MKEEEDFMEGSAGRGLGRWVSRRKVLGSGNISCEGFKVGVVCD